MQYDRDGENLGKNHVIKHPILLKIPCIKNLAVTPVISYSFTRKPNKHGKNLPEAFYEMLEIANDPIRLHGDGSMQVCGPKGPLIVTYRRLRGPQKGK